MSSETDTKSNVVSLAAFALRDKSAPAATEDAALANDFEAEARRNAANKARLAKERANANAATLRQYRIKT